MIGISASDSDPRAVGKQTLPEEEEIAVAVV